MAELKVYLSAELDKRFRMLAMTIFGCGRGSLSEAAVEALSSWCKQNESRKDDFHRVETPSRESDLVARAEERPGMPPAPKEKDTQSVLNQGNTHETVPPGNEGKKRN